ncbi:zinc finger protein 37-like [Sparus aurata]|uniref:zinc finger protein 37-like n=1 Tax=Sparus aurata TaxID=8175 RepID=UPI0011C0D2A5|nr:zinc finger protein 37-like [Sparus aurata]
MSSVEYLRNFLSERLTAAAEEIFGVFIKSIVEYEEEIDRQRRLLDVVLKPEIKLHKLELPQQHVFTEEEEEVLSDQQLCDQERNSSLDQEDPADPPQIQEEHKEPCTSLEGEQFSLKLETDTFMLTPTYMESDYSEPESKSDRQFLSDDWHVVKSQDQKGGMYGDFRPTTSTEPEATKTHPKSRSQSVAASRSNVSETGHTMHTELPQQHNSMEKEEEDILTDQQLCIQGRISSLDQEDLDPPQIKEEHVELCTSLEEQQLILKPETDTFMMTATYEESDHNVPEPESDRQLLFENWHVAESQVQKVGPQSMINTEPGPEKSHPKSRSQSIIVPKSSFSQIDHYMHRGEKKQYSCEACGKAFKYKSRLCMHMKTHTGEMPYSCTTCGQGFSFRSSLMIHMRIHTGEKPFVCKTCGRGFTRRAHMTVHMRRAHTGEKPYVCKICGMRYFEKSVLTRHSLIHEN